MKRASLTLFAAAIGLSAAASKCEPDPPAAVDGQTSGAANDEGGLGTASPAEVGGAKEADRRDLLLAELSARLDRVQIAGHDEQVSTGGGLALEPLLGTTQSQLRAALGAPHTCRKKQSTESDGNRSLAAPCQTDDDWFYSFYHLPAGAVGGGPELLLQFDNEGNCVSARWVLTR